MSSEFELQPKSAWSEVGKREQIRKFASKYIDFLNSCKTERETIDYIQTSLLNAGFSENGIDCMYRILRGKTLFAAKRGKKPLSEGLNIIAAHIDSPRLDLKQRPFIEQASVLQAKTHYYGGIHKYQWLARPLALHGVICLQNGQKITLQIGEKPGDPVFCISDLLPHLAQKQIEKKVKDAFEGEKLSIIIGHEPAQNADKDKKEENPIKKLILELLQRDYNITEEDFITAEIEAVPAAPASFVGFDQALIGGYGQDDRICAFCALEAFISACASTNPENNIAVIFWDKEEIGSYGSTGASSKFLEFCVEDLASLWGHQDRTSKILLSSKAICADVTAALDPDFQEAHDKNNAAYLGYGICISKFTGSRGKYNTSDADAEFYAQIRAMLNVCSIPWQAVELGKVDTGGGGTEALFLAALGMQTIDCGPALLSMHSPFEISSAADLGATKNAFLAFFENCK